MGFVNFDYAGDLDKIRSLTGYVFMLCGNAISWKANLQSIVALSTTKTEYIAITEVVKEALWVKGLVNELGMVQECISVMCDSQSVMHLSKNQMYHERTKHIDVRLHFVRDFIAQRLVKIEKVSSEDNAANMMTKVVTLSKFKHCMDLVGVIGK